MGRAHGFRIYLVEAFRNQIKDHEPEDVTDGSTAQAEILDLLEDLQGTHFVEPRARRAGEPTPPTRTISVGVASPVRRDLHHVVVAIGERGSHGRAVHETDGTVDLTGRSPEADHYLTLLFPNGAGTRFVVVAHTIRGRDPLPLLLPLMQRQSMNRKRHAEAVEREQRRQARAEHAPVPERQQHTRLLFRAHQAVDARYLEDLIGSASNATAEFQAFEPSDRGARRTRVRRALRIALIDERELDIARGAARSWARSFRSGTPKTRPEGVAELAGLLESENLLSDGEGDQYANASVRVTGEDNAATRIAVDTIRDVFTYGIADNFPPRRFYYERVAARLPGVLADEQINVDSFDPLEVANWLDAST